jgi:hypothetical protein
MGSITRYEGAPMNYQGLGDWLAQIEQNFNAERTGASIFCRFREAASSSEFI